MATSGDTKYKVVIPDWFKGEPAPLEWFPPDTEEKQKNLGAFFQKNPPPGVSSQLPGYAKALSEKYPAIKEWAILGVSIPLYNPQFPYPRNQVTHRNQISRLYMILVIPATPR